MPPSDLGICFKIFSRLHLEASHKMAEEEDFVLVERVESDDDDAVSVSSSRSSLCLVEDPSNDSLMLHGESPLKRSVVSPPNADEEAVDREAPLPPSTEADAPIPEAPAEEVRSLVPGKLQIRNTASPSHLLLL